MELRFPCRQLHQLVYPCHRYWNQPGPKSLSFHLPHYSVRGSAMKAWRLRLVFQTAIYVSVLWSLCHARRSVACVPAMFRTCGTFVQFGRTYCIVAMVTALSRRVWTSDQMDSVFYRELAPSCFREYVRYWSTSPPSSLVPPRRQRAAAIVNYCLLARFILVIRDACIHTCHCRI